MPTMSSAATVATKTDQISRSISSADDAVAVCEAPSLARTDHRTMAISAMCFGN